jgi:hypothetical protein
MTKISTAAMFGKMLKMLPEWSEIISYDKRNKHIFLKDVTGEKKAQEAHYYSKFLYEFRGGKYGRGRVLGTVYEHHYEYAFKANAQMLQVWQNGKMVYQCPKKWLVKKTRDLRYRAYLRRKYGTEAITFHATIAPHRTYTVEVAERNRILARASQVLPAPLFKELLSWKTISKSPYSNSYYNSTGISWSGKPEGSLRISDHWNFYSQGATHCKTDVVKYSGWECLQYHEGRYYTQEEYQLIISQDEVLAA